MQRQFHRFSLRILLCGAWLVTGTVSCGKSTAPSDVPGFECASAKGESFDSLPLLGCEEDFDRASAEPADSSLPGARSVKTIIDRVDGNRLYFLNTNEYPLHFEFASTHLSAVGDLPVIANQSDFNDNYVSPQRRFYLGTITTKDRRSGSTKLRPTTPRLRA
jgi:hypothetical protein